MCSALRHGGTSFARPSAALLAGGVWLLLLFLLSGASIPLKALALQQAEAPRPNIVLILTDDLGYGDLSSYGASDAKTPHMDALVEAGMRFDRFYANAPVCSPTRAAPCSYPTA